MRVSDFNKKKVYSEASGVVCVIDQAISMSMNDLGLYEEIIQKDENEEISDDVLYVSPNFNSSMDETMMSQYLYSSIPNINFDERIGYYLSLYAGYVVEGEYRKNASSGGIGTWILKELLEQDYIDGVIHVKENKDRSSPILFKYDISYSIEEVIEGAKTRYYPVELSEVLKKVKEQPKRYALIGIPSFIMAVRLLALKDPVINESIVFTVGLICGHQKSSKFAEAMAWQVGIKPGDLTTIDFRKKLSNRPATQYGVELVGNINGQKVNIIKPNYEFIGQNWGQGFFKPLASDFTDDVMNETADVTIGDAWLPQYSKDSEGTNIVIVRHPIIQNIITNGLLNKKIYLDSISKELVFQSQAAHYRHTHDELAYRLHKKDQQHQWRPKKRVQATKDIPYLRRKVQNIREEIAKQSHVVYSTAVKKNDFDYFKSKMSVIQRRYEWVYLLMNHKSITFKVLVAFLIKPYKEFFLKLLPTRSR